MSFRKFQFQLLFFIGQKRETPPTSHVVGGVAPLRGNATRNPGDGPRAAAAAASLVPTRGVKFVKCPRLRLSGRRSAAGRWCAAPTESVPSARMSPETAKWTLKVSKLPAAARHYPISGLANVSRRRFNPSLCLCGRQVVEDGGAAVCWRSSGRCWPSCPPPSSSSPSRSQPGCAPRWNQLAKPSKIELLPLRCLSEAFHTFKGEQEPPVRQIFR